jgi:hypothetical protein
MESLLQMTRRQAYVVPVQGGNPMPEVRDLEQAVENLSREDYARFRRWFLHKDWELWEKQIEDDSESGRLDFLLDEAEDRTEQRSIDDL